MTSFSISPQRRKQLAGKPLKTATTKVSESKALYCQSSVFGRISPILPRIKARGELFKSQENNKNKQAKMLLPEGRDLPLNSACKSPPPSPPPPPLSRRWLCHPQYADLGKSARDVFTKGYGFGLIKLDLKTKSENGLEFTSSGSANTETTKVTGSLETKYRWTEYGLTFTEKWNTDNTLGTEITVEDQLARGLKLTFDSSFSPNTGEKNAKIKTGYKREHINLGCDMDFDIAGPSIRGALVLGYEGWLAGYQMNFETAKSQVTQSNFAVGYKTDEFQLHTNVNDGTEFGGSIYQKVNKNLETAVNLRLDSRKQ
ncbi:hypothetical protein H8959_019028 [Pygathrix nigripes]